MKKTKVLLLALVAGAIVGGSAAAQTPSSNTKTVTSGLIRDGLVDSFDTGVEGKKILFFGSYGMNDNLLQAGYGQRFGEKLWFSLYDGYFLKADETKEETAAKDSVAHDGVNTDYTDNSSTAKVSGSSRIKNNLAFSAYFNNKIGGTFYWNTDTSTFQGYDSANPTGAITDKNGTTTTNDSSEDHAAGTSVVTKYDTLVNKKQTNVFGVDFNGITTKPMLGEKEFYFQLNTLQLTWQNRLIDLGWKTSSSLNGSSIDGLDQPKYSGTYDYNSYTPYLEFETGLTFKKLWDTVTPSFVLINGFDMTFRDNKNDYKYSKLTSNTYAEKVSESTNYKMDQGDYINWHDTITPRFKFKFDLDERITLKARAQAAVSFGNVTTGADKYTKTVTTTTIDNLTGDTTISQTVTKSGAAQETEVFTTEVTPQFRIGFVYKVIPEKFNFNMGVTASSGTLTWKKSTATNSNIAEESVTRFTNAAGETTVTSTSYTPSNGDGTEAGDAAAEKQTNTFTSTEPSATARMGFTWFLADKAQLDSFILFGTSAGSSAPTWAMNVAFGLKI